MRASHKLNLIDKVGKLFSEAGFKEMISPGDLVAVKLHFGEKGNTSFIRPQFIRKIVEEIKKLGGKPFLTDANTLYVGSRSNGRPSENGHRKRFCLRGGGCPPGHCRRAVRKGLYSNTG